MDILCKQDEYFFRNVNILCKKDSKDQDSIQSSTTPVPGYQKGK